MKLYELTEASVPENFLRNRTYYHGTKNVEAARAIIKNGLQPPEHNSRSLMTPVNGMVYLTPSLPYSIIYAVGGSMLGSSHLRVPYRGDNKEMFEQRVFRGNGRYGYVFLVDGNDLIDIQPDEDELGHLYYYEANKSEPLQEWTDDDGFYKAWMKYIANPIMRARFVRFMDSYLTDNQKRRIKDGEYAYYASGGKRALKYMPDDLKIWLSDIGLHIAHQGAIKPYAAYKFDKAKIGWIKPDGSNFFDIATQIKI